MTPRLLLLAVALVASAVPLQSAQSPAPAAGETLPPSVTPEQVFENYGWVTGQENNLAAFGLSEAELAAYVRGLTAAARDKAPPASFEQVRESAEGFLNARVARVRERVLATNRAEEQQLFQAFDRRATVKKTDSGLRYEILEPGSAERAELKDSVLVRYQGSFPDGTVFDSKLRVADPVSFRLMGVVPAWQEGLRFIGPGGRIRLYVPSKLGFGDFGSDGVPPAKALIYEIELVSIQPGVAGASPAPAPTR